MYKLDKFNSKKEANISKNNKTTKLKNIKSDNAYI